MSHGLHVLHRDCDPAGAAEADALDGGQTPTHWETLPGFIRRAPGPTAEQLRSVIAAIASMPAVLTHHSLATALHAAYEFTEDMQ